MWPEAGASGHRYQSLKRFVFKVPWYKNGKEVHDGWQSAHPNQTIKYDPGGVFTNLFLKYPGWRAREGYGQPALGLVGVDACPPACVGAVSVGYKQRARIASEGHTRDSSPLELPQSAWDGPAPTAR